MAASTSAPAAEEQAIRARIRDMVAAVQQKDADRTASFYAEDGVFFWPGIPPAEGRSAIRDTWASFMATEGFELDFWPVRFDFADSDDMALEVGAFRLMGQDGKYIITWKKQGGHWMILADAPSVNA